MSAPTYVLSGGGYGHGVGLNQYGALGQAKANRTYKDILAFDYPGTALTKAPITTVRVLIADSRPSIKVGSAAAVHGHRRHRHRSRRCLPVRSPLKPDLKVVVPGQAEGAARPARVHAGEGSPR